MFCPKCGNILPENAKFCTSCGAPVENTTKVNEACDHSHGAGTYTEPSRPYVAPGQSRPVHEATVIGKRSGPVPPVSPLDALRLFVANIINFSGRSRRSEYWWVMLVTGIIGLILEEISADLTSIWNVILLVPTLSLTVRRLHDVGKGTLYVLWMLIPIAGPLIVLVHLIRDSEPGENKYGPNPKEL